MKIRKASLKPVCGARREVSALVTVFEDDVPESYLTQLSLNDGNTKVCAEASSLSCLKLKNHQKSAEADSMVCFDFRLKKHFISD